VLPVNILLVPANKMHAAACTSLFLVVQRFWKEGQVLLTHSEEPFTALILSFPFTTTTRFGWIIGQKHVEHVREERNSSVMATVAYRL
jgi:hypothetical protein